MARPVQQWREVLGSIHAYNESCAAGTPDLNQLRECEQLLNRSMDATGSNWHKLVYSEKVRVCQSAPRHNGAWPRITPTDTQPTTRCKRPRQQLNAIARRA